MGQLQPTADHKEIHPSLGWDWMRSSNCSRPSARAVSSDAQIRRLGSRSQMPRCHLPNSPSIQANGSTDSRYSVQHSDSVSPSNSCRQSARSASTWQPVWEAPAAWKSPPPTHRSGPAPARRFDLRKFNRTVLEEGVVPLSELRVHVEDWIATQSAGNQPTVNVSKYPLSIQTH
jgi:hypothetical protein